MSFSLTHFLPSTSPLPSPPRHCARPLGMVPDRPRPQSSAAASRWRPWRSPHRSSPPHRRARPLAVADQRRLPLPLWRPQRCCRGAPPGGRCGSSGSGALAPSLLAQVGRDASFSRRRIRGDPSLAGARRPPPHPCHAPASLAARASLQLGECGE
jgi:hypothetical protein